MTDERIAEGRKVKSIACRSNGESVLTGAVLTRHKLTN